MMRNKYLVSGIIVLMLLVLVSCGGGIYLNKSYKPNSDRCLSLSIMPVLGEMPVDVKFIFEDMFKYPEAPYEVKKLPNNLFIYEPDSAIIDIMLAISNIEYESEDLNKTPNLRDHISPENFEVFRAAIENPDLLLVPARFSLKEIESSVVGKTKIRLYDLKTGQLIFQRSLFADINSGYSPYGGGLLGGLLRVWGAGGKVSEKKTDDAVDCVYLLATQAVMDINKEVFNISEEE